MEGEQFFSYVQVIKDATLVIRINESEAEVVERVVEGLTPTQRVHSFSSPTFLLPTTRTIRDSG